MIRASIVSLGLWAIAAALPAAELHVAVTGNDAQPGTRELPLRMIQRAADLAQPGDTVTVHAGTYRECVNPPRGGESDARRIIYQAAPGETVEIKGSEVVKGWMKVQDGVWKATLPNTLFGRFNPFADAIRGDWFNPKGRPHHTGAVYLNGQWLTEAARQEEVLQPAGETPLWFAAVDGSTTTVWAQFPGVDPNQQLVEVNVRQTVFYPDAPGRNFITVRGFTLTQAATNWAPPTAEQIGLIGTHWSQGWIIENNRVSHSVCSGIALGKHGDQFDNTSANTAEGYVKTIERAHAQRIPWTKEHIGHHIVRHNHVSHCEQAGIVGSLGCAFSSVTDNVIHDVHVRRLFTGAEMAGIKFHAAIDTDICRNHIYRTTRGLWLDWMAQGTRVSQNLFHDNITEDVFVEVNHGPFLVDNNLFLSPTSLLDWSQGGAYAHNLFAGRIVSRPELRRETPYHPAHSTTVAGLMNIQGGDDRFYNNIFVGNGDAGAGPAKPASGKRPADAGFGLAVYDAREFPLHAGGNVYLNGAQPYAKETAALVLADWRPEIALEEQQGRWRLRLSLPEALAGAKTAVVTSARLGSARVAKLPYVNPDDTPLAIKEDYFGQARSDTSPAPGPFAVVRPGPQTIELRR